MHIHTHRGKKKKREKKKTKFPLGGKKGRRETSQVITQPVWGGEKIYEGKTLRQGQKRRERERGKGARRGTEKVSACPRLGMQEGFRWGHSALVFSW